MMGNVKQCLLPVIASVLLAPVLLPGFVQGAQGTAPAAAGAVADIKLSYKRDPRLVDPFRGIGPWAEGPDYGGATAQESVETLAVAINHQGQPLTVNLEWAVSDPEMVTVSPNQGAHVTIKVLRPGETKLKIMAQGFSKELIVHADKVGNYLVFGISRPAPPKAVSQAMDPSLKDQKEQFSYATGMRLAKTLRAQSQDVDPDLVAKAMKDILAGRATLMSDAQAQGVLQGVETELNVTAAMLEKKKIAENNRKEAEEFLAENKKKEGVIALPSGLQYKVIKGGTGKKPTKVDVAVCQYTGMLSDGTVFDDSRKRKDEGPVTFPVKAVIKGWQEALQMMPAGSEWQLFVPPDLAYGERGVPQSRIPPNAALVFDVELLSVRGPNDPAPETQKAALTPEQLEAVKKMIQEKMVDKERSEKNQ